MTEPQIHIFNNVNLMKKILSLFRQLMSEKINRQDVLIKDLISRIDVELPDSKMENSKSKYSEL